MFEDLQMTGLLALQEQSDLPTLNGFPPSYRPPRLLAGRYIALHHINTPLERVPYFVFLISVKNEKWNLETHFSIFRVTLK